MRPTRTPFPQARDSLALQEEDRFMAAHGTMAAGLVLAWVEAIGTGPRRLGTALRGAFGPLRHRFTEHSPGLIPPAPPHRRQGLRRSSPPL